MKQRILFLLALAAALAQAQTGITLSQAIEQALQNNVRAKIAQESIVESRATVGIARSALLPNLSGSAYQINRTANLAALGLTPATFPGIPVFVGPYSTFDARVQLGQNLFNLAALRRYQESKTGVMIAEEQKQFTDQQIITTTTLAYIAVLAARESVAAAEANLALARRLYDLSLNQRNAGVGTGMDVARAETRVATQQMQVAQAQNGLDTARLNLLRITGAPLTSDGATADAMHFTPQTPPAAEQAIQTALDARVELALAADQLKAAVLEKKAAMAGYAPSVAFFGDYGSSGLKPNEVNLPTRSVGLKLDVPIFDGGRTRAQVQAANSRVREAELQLNDLKTAVEKDVRQALADLGTREEQMKAAQKTLELAQKELELAQDRYKNGVADNIEVTNAQTALENARMNVVASLAQFNVARLNLYAAQGRVRDFNF